VTQHKWPPTNPERFSARRRHQRYGTLICDLDRHRTIALLPNREPATTEEWLLDQQQIAIVARDRSGAYAQAISKALPRAIQAADLITCFGEMVKDKVPDPFDSWLREAEISAL
jgi:transposase